MIFHEKYGDCHSFVFIGEAGSGKSEIALNAALMLAGCGDKPVHFFDLDMTKPIFRSRDMSALLESRGVTVHYEEQYFDAPTLVGGIAQSLRDSDCYSVFDVGGDYIGARVLGGFSQYLNAGGSAVFYVVNSYRPWSADIEHIDAVLSQILGVSHIELRNLRFIGNPNLGAETTAEEFREGAELLRSMLESIVKIDFFCAREELLGELPEDYGIMPLKLLMGYEWQQER